MAVLGTALHTPGRVWARLCAAVLLLAGPGARADGPSEYQIKAVFLFNFAQFVEWPSTAFDGPKAPLVIGVLGEDPFGSSLDTTVRGEIINQRPLVVRRFQRVEEVDHCHILFVSRSESKRLEAVVAALRGRTILTVGDTDGFALRGVMIRFITEKNRIRLRINLEAAKAAGLVVSSKLLRPAEIVTTQEK
jgi:hypothetical protein